MDLVRVTARAWVVEVLEVPQKKGCPDMVFTANAGQTSCIACPPGRAGAHRTFIPSHFRFVQRRGEESAFIGYFRKKGYRIKDSARGLLF